jgi:hypothetical protein
VFAGANGEDNMTRQTPIDAINGTINALRYSLARYLRFARPWVDASAESIAEMIEKVAASHRQHFTRLGELLVERHGHVESRAFPSVFTRLNDLSIEYLLPLVIEDEKQIIRVIESNAVVLGHDAEASSLLDEVLDCEKRHLQVLERLPVRRAAMSGGSFIQPRHRASNWQAEGESLRPRMPLGRRGALSNGRNRSRGSGTPVASQKESRSLHHDGSQTF